MFGQQFGMMFKDITTNERINSWRYNYLKDADGKFYNPFDFGKKNNCLMFFGCMKYPEVDVSPYDVNTVQKDVSFYAQEQPKPAGHGQRCKGGHGGNHGHSHGH